MFKRITAIVIALLITLGGVDSVTADSTAIAPVSSGGGTVSSSITVVEPGNIVDDKNLKVSKEEAKEISIELIKKYFGLEVDEKKYQVTVQLAPNYQINKGSSWQFNWNTNNSAIFMHISMEIDASTGKLIGFNRSENYRNQEQVVVADITKEQARVKAEEFLEKINPEEFKQVKFQDYGNENIYYNGIRPNYNFHFTREINGLSYPGNGIMLGINGADGSVVDYRLNWQYDIELPVAKSLLEKEKALKIFKDRMSMDLFYMPIRSKLARYMVTSEVKLVYMPSQASGMIIDAQTGDSLNYNGQKLDSLKKRDITQEQKNKIIAGKSKPSGEVGELSSEKAEDYINSIAKEFFGAGYKVGNLSYSDNGMVWPEGNRKTWNAEITEDKPEAFQGIGNISIDSASGEVLNIGRYMYEDWYGKEFERKLSWEQAYDKAVEVLGRYYPYRLGDIRTVQVYQENLYPVNGKLVPDRMIYFNFPRLVNGIQYANDSINISIDTKTGEAENVNCNWNTPNIIPSTVGIMDKEKAKEMFFKEYDVKLIYSQYNKNTEGNEYSPEYRIVYTLEQKQKGNRSMNIDAFSGKLLNHDGSEQDDVQSDFYEIIKGNPAEKELSILAFQNIIDTGSFRPDREITYIELIRMLVNAKGYRPYMTREQEELLFKNVDKKSENYSYLSEAVRHGIIENKSIDLKLDAKVTREQMAEWIVKLLKYEKLAKAKDIFVSGYKDADEISSDLKGHVAIVKGLGITEGTSEMFRPKENLKMQEAALIVYRALDTIRE